MNFNFEGENLAEMFNITEERITVLAKNIANIIIEVGNDFDGFRCECNNCKADKDKISIHRGKVFRKMLDGIEAENEKFFMANRLDDTCDLIDHQIKKNMLREALKGGIDKLFGNIFK